MFLAHLFFCDFEKFLRIAFSYNTFEQVLLNIYGLTRKVGKVSLEGEGIALNKKKGNCQMTEITGIAEQ